MINRATTRFARRGLRRHQIRSETDLGSDYGMRGWPVPPCSVVDGLSPYTLL